MKSRSQPRYAAGQRSPVHSDPLLVAMFGLAFLATTARAAFDDPNADLEKLPKAPPGFVVGLFAREPLVRNPCSMAFDARGRMFVGMGPQYRNPAPDTPPDGVFILLDTDGDGIAETKKEFATGFNNIQALAWHGRDLWVANSPDLTIVRDLDRDDRADEYVLIYTDLGNIEHGLHGLNWAPDGRLYMSKGNSKGLSLPGRVAPAPFRELWGMSAPPGSPDLPAARIFKPGEYRATYHNPSDDWGREGGVLRCDDMGRNLEIVSRGLRNPWDITYDDHFDWLGTDNDQNEGDRIIMPFFGAHFGWSHSWSSDWTGENHLPTAPISGPVFQGSGTGIIFYNEPQFPPEYRVVFFVNDWLQKTTMIYRPAWNGALSVPEGGRFATFLSGADALFRPTDIEVGPDGALYCLGWGRGYGVEWENGEMANEGRVFRVRWKDAPPVVDPLPRETPHERWTFEQLLADFDSALPVRRIEAQDELVRRGKPIARELTEALSGTGLTDRQRTWTLWTLGRIAPDDEQIDAYFAEICRARIKSHSPPDATLRQTIRILGDRAKRSGRTGVLNDVTPALLNNPDARIRFEAVQAIWQSGIADIEKPLIPLIRRETDRITFYSAWRALGDRLDAGAVRRLLHDEHPRARLAALLAALDTKALSKSEVEALADDPDGTVRETASLWLAKTSSGVSQSIVKGRPLDVSETEIRDEPTTAEAALAVLDDVHPEAGERLFFKSGCANCHRVGKHGSDTAPDLTNLGARTDLAHVIESMLDPGAVITEGYGTQVVETQDTSRSGILVEETDYFVTLALATGERVRIAKDEIVSRDSFPVSAMPSFAWMLSPRGVADIATWLLQARTDTSDNSADADGFSWKKEPDHLAITLDGVALADFVFRDDQIRRPYFAGIHTLDGIQVTRNHPPVEGVDRADHATMHPGIWIAFGDIDGHDFWRNRATILHDRFSMEPHIDTTAAGNALSFATESTLVTEGGDSVARLESRFRFSTVHGGWLLAWDAGFAPVGSELVFGDQEEMGFGVRVAALLTEKNGGTIRSDSGAETAERTWGRVFDWCDYSGTVEGKHAGIAVMAHPSNFRRSWFHNRNYGLMVANPFGQNAFTDEKKSRVVVPNGEKLRLRWAAFIHSGETGDVKNIAEVFETYSDNEEQR